MAAVSADLDHAAVVSSCGNDLATLDVAMCPATADGGDVVFVLQWRVKNHSPHELALSLRCNIGKVPGVAVHGVSGRAAPANAQVIGVVGSDPVSVRVPPYAHRVAAEVRLPPGRCVPPNFTFAWSLARGAAGVEALSPRPPQDGPAGTDVASAGAAPGSAGPAPAPQSGPGLAPVPAVPPLFRRTAAAAPQPPQPPQPPQSTRTDRESVLRSLFGSGDAASLAHLLAPADASDGRESAAASGGGAANAADGGEWSRLRRESGAGLGVLEHISFESSGGGGGGGSGGGGSGGGGSGGPGAGSRHALAREQLRAALRPRLRELGRLRAAMHQHVQHPTSSAVPSDPPAVPDPKGTVLKLPAPTEEYAVTVWDPQFPEGPRGEAGVIRCRTLRTPELGPLPPPPPFPPRLPALGR